MSDKKSLSERLELRLSIEEKNEIRRLAEVYGYNNMSAYVIHRTLYASRKTIKAEDFDYSDRRIKKAPNSEGPINDKN